MKEDSLKYLSRNMSMAPVLIILMGLFTSCKSKTVSPLRKSKTVSHLCKSKTVSPALVNTSKDTLMYCYDNRDFHDEDCYLKLYLEDGRVMKGLFWGTTDEFTDAREGFVCGFFVLPISQIRQKEDSLFFTLDARKEKFFTKAIPLDITKSQEAIKKKFQLWDIYVTDSVVSYTAKVSKDSLSVRNMTFETYPPERTFVRKEPANSVKRE